MIQDEKTGWMVALFAGANYYATVKGYLFSATTVTAISTATIIHSSASLNYNVAYYPPSGKVFGVFSLDGGTKNFLGSSLSGFAANTTVTFTTPFIVDNNTNNRNSMGNGHFLTYAPTPQRLVLATSDFTNSSVVQGDLYVIRPVHQSTNLTSTNFLGITDSAISSGAAGKVTIKGGLKTGLAGGTFAVTVANPGSGNRYYINGVLQYTLNLREGFTYKFDQSASSNSNHPFRFSTTSNGSHASGSEYTTGVTTSGTPGNAGAYTQIVVAASAPTLYYYCTNHSGMGGTANTLAAIVPNSVYYVQGDGTLSTTTTSPAVRIGKALSSTSINLEFNS